MPKRVTQKGIWCIVPAAGTGRRAGGGMPKQYRPLLGKPMLLRTMERLAQHPKIAGLIVVLDPYDRRWGGWVMCLGKPVRTCNGGRERVDSVRAGLALAAQFEPGDAWVLVHDAARPCVPHADIDRLLREGMRHGVGALLAARVHDTIKRAELSGNVAETVPRDNLWRALTPQLFRLGELTQALASVDADPALAGGITDESSAFEAAGRKPLLVEGSEDNLKVTSLADFARAEAVLRAQGERPA
ncbi:MAG TPA: 2-C-methyl-D-erythritol 4-phosphate cytidylyltransferase [Candidatus Saccharimonadia bacterium]|nr:2-C-methyl-D-erythritol 4-phosphate cytidylyltransferase [Candidatus Saccharimonadia bacterium]